MITTKILTTFSHTHAVCKTTLPRVKFDEEEFTSLPETKEIIKVKSNFCTKDSLIPVKKKKDYIKKRKGNKESFDSMIELFVKTSQGYLYKPKVFCNGETIIPGVKNQDISDIYEPLTILCKYLDDQKISKPGCYFTLPKIITHNYKAKVGFKINPRKLIHVLRRHCRPPLTFPLIKLKKFLSVNTQIYNGEEKGQWMDMIISGSLITSIDTTGIVEALFPWDISLKKKTDITSFQLFTTNEEDLYELSTSKELMYIYNTTLRAIKTIILESFSDMSNEEIEFVIFVQIEKYIDNVFTKKDQRPFNYFYTNDKITKITIKYNTVSIVLYNSGKLNIHGIRNGVVLLNVRVWLTSILELYLQEFGGHKDNNISESEYTKFDSTVKITKNIRNITVNQQEDNKNHQN